MSKPRNLNELHNINKKTVGILERAGWTIEELATADVKTLKALPGIGVKVAGDVIKAAQLAVNNKLLQESQYLDRPQYSQQDDPHIQRSVRVQRIMDAHKEGRLI